MKQEKTIRQTGVVSVLFLVILVVLSILEEQVFSGAFTNPTLVGVALVPILFFLIMTGRLQRFSGGGFEIVLQEQARKFVSTVASEKVDADPERIKPKAQTSELVDIKERAPTVLTFELRRQGFYEKNAIVDYLESLETLQYVIFTHADAQFEGYTLVDSFRQLLENDEVNVVNEIETGEIIDRAIVKTERIRSDSTNRECLQEMEKRNVSELAVVSSEKKFVSIVTQDAIIRKLMSSALSEM